MPSSPRCGRFRDPVEEDHQFQLSLAGLGSVEFDSPLNLWS